MRNILKNIYKELSKEYTVYGVFVYGSQNYGLDTLESDIDTKAIVIPSFSDLVHKAPISKVKNFDFGECDIKDIREMMKSYKKQNVNFIETLFTKYNYVNPKFRTVHHELIDRREDIAHFDEKKAIDCFNGLMMQSKKRLTHITEATSDEITEYGYHRKSLMNIYKYRKMVEKYTEGLPYKDVLWNSECGIFRVEPVSDFESLAKQLDDEAAEIIRAYTPKSKNEELDKWLDEWVERVIYEYV